MTETPRARLWLPCAHLPSQHTQSKKSQINAIFLCVFVRLEIEPRVLHELGKFLPQATQDSLKKKLRGGREEVPC